MCLGGKLTLLSALTISRFSWKSAFVTIRTVSTFWPFTWSVSAQCAAAACRFSRQPPATDPTGSRQKYSRNGGAAGFRVRQRREQVTLPTGRCGLLTSAPPVRCQWSGVLGTTATPASPPAPLILANGDLIRAYHALGMLVHPRCKILHPHSCLRNVPCAFGDTGSPPSWSPKVSSGAPDAARIPPSAEILPSPEMFMPNVIY